MSSNDGNANANANANNGENEEFLNVGDEGANGDEGNNGGDEGNNSNNKKPVETDEQRLARFQRMTNQTRKKMGLDPIDFEGNKKPSNKKGKDNGSSEAPDGLDYAQKAYMNSLGFKSQEQYDLAFEAMQNSGKSLDQVLDSKWFQEDLANLATKNAIPKGKDGRSNNTIATDTPEYWIAKGEMPPNTPENQELRRKIVNAKVAKGKSGNKFSANPVVGNQ